MIRHGVTLLKRRSLNPMTSSNLDGIWCCSSGFHTDGLVDEGVVPARELPMGGPFVGVFGPLRSYHCTIHQEKVIFALT
ncbi:hypothetical protein ACIBK9_47180 [Nonomuraea sp. NPDC050227]|uniref:hypothetical protein n=1 Tax=Nonomuraea sp. NPDC050227 TaxID=3364360 RepID=UPI0037B7445D